MRPLLAISALALWAVACSLTLRLGPSIDVWTGPDASSEGGVAVPSRFGLVTSTTVNPTGMNQTCNTGLTEANGIVCKASAAHVRSCYVFNNTQANAWAVFADSTQIPTSFVNNQDASTSDSGPGMISTPYLVPTQSGVIIGTDYFGVDGWYTTTGFAVGMSTTSSQGDAGTDAGWFAAAGNYFDISCAVQ